MDRELTLPPLSLFEQYSDLPRLARSIRRTGTAFSLFFAECNVLVLREKLADELDKQLSVPAKRISLNKLEIAAGVSLDEAIAEQLVSVPKEVPVFLFGLEQLLPTGEKEKLRATVQQLNWRRSSFARLQRPLVIWLPSYAVNLLAEQTPDFYDWNSGTYVFRAGDGVVKNEVSQAFEQLRSIEGVHAADHLSVHEKKRWLHSLKSLLAEYKSDDNEKANLLADMGSISLSLSEYDDALSFFRQALNIYQNIDNKQNEGVMLNNVSQIYHNQGDYDTALEYLQQALQIRQKIGDKNGEGTTLNNISQICGARGDYDTALDYLQQALQIRQKIGDKNGEGTTLNNISQIYHARGDYDTALDYLQQALQIRQQIGDKNGEGATLNNMATTAHARGDYDTALDYLQQALQIQQEIGDKNGEGTTLNNMATTAHARGDYDTALDYLQQALQIQQEIGDKNGEGTTLNNISQIYDSRGDYDTALDYLQQALQIQQEIGDAAGLCTTLFNIGHIYRQNNEDSEALNAWLRAYTFAKKINLAQVLDALKNLAGQIDLPNGLNSWEELAQQHPKNNPLKPSPQSPQTAPPNKAAANTKDTQNP